MEEFSFYTFGTPEYFDTLNRFPNSPVYFELLKSLVPADWTVSRFDVWLQAKSEKTVLKRQGFKIHVSASAGSAETVLRRAVPECVRAGVMFKTVADPLLLRFLNSKRYSRGGSGKFMTLYPPDEATFLSLIEALHQSTRDLAGPYILSDKRYRDSKLIFYRYGGFQRMYELRPDGMQIPQIQTPEGRFIQDARLPYFQVPDWVKDPVTFVEEGPPKGSGLLHDRYKVESALSFTNTGGVYRAIDQRTGRPVVIKEARPYTEAWMGANATVDATAALQKEYDNLHRVQGLPCVPKLIELFQEWEHTFLVTSFFEGVPLTNLRANDDFILMTHMDDVERIIRFCSTWRDLTLRLLDAIEAIHARGLIFGDISPGNVLMNVETGDILLIDFEGALVRGETSAFSAQWFNPGFRKQDRRLGRSLEPFDDFYACGMLLYNLICPTQTLFQLDSEHPVFRFLDHFIEAGLPVQVRDIIQSLLEGDATAARRQAKAWEPKTCSFRESVPPGRPKEVSSPVALEADPFRATVQGLARHMLASMDTHRTDRLFPQDPMAFQTNPMNLAHGACGTALFLHDVLGELPSQVRDWLLSQPIDNQSYPPGLYSGIAGVAWSFAEMGMLERALELFEQVPSSWLAFKAPSMFDGSAGWGLASIALHLRTREAKYLELACRAGDHLLSIAEKSAQGRCWRSETDGSVRLGFAIGGSGIAFFLLSLWRATGEARYLSAAREAMDFEIAQAQPQGDTLVWGITVGGSGHRPYWFRGGAGVASTLIRFFHVLKEERYLELARRAARGCGVFFSAAPHLFEGLASMGETQLDMYQVTGEPHYLELARQKASQTLLYRMDRPQGLAFPGRYLMRISHDYGVGGAGIGLFLHRLMGLRPRRFHDIFPDDLGHRAVGE